jgi:hypothetical protein
MRPFARQDSRKSSRKEGRTHGRRKRRTTPTCAGLLIVLTGSRNDDHFRVDVDGKPSFLPYASLGVLVDLICARVQTDSGFIDSGRSTIYRLRKALDANAGAGKRLIETGSGEEYRLTIPKAELHTRVGVTACFFDLVARNLFTKGQAEVLREHCQRCPLRDTEPVAQGRLSGD